MNKSNDDRNISLSQVLIAVCVIVAAIVITGVLFWMRPQAVKAISQENVALVETVVVKKEDRPIIVEAFGTVQPHRELTVFTEVKGKIIEQSPNLDAGGILKNGEVMLKLDPRDYIDAVEQARALVEKAEFNLVVEKGRKVIAEKEWELLDPSLKQGGFGKNLALRIPHIREKESTLQASISQFDKAVVDLKRTVIKAPFNALVLEEVVEVGQVLLPQTKVAVLVSTDQYRVQVSVPYSELSWIEIPRSGQVSTTPVEIIQEIGEGKTIKREGHVLRLMGDLDPNGRMAQLLIVIDDPLGLENKDKSSIPLLLGTYVKVRLKGPVVQGVVVLSRNAIHEGNKVWVKNADNKLEVREVTVISGDQASVIIKDGLEDGDEVVVSSLPVAIPGMLLKSINSQ